MKYVTQKAFFRELHAYSKQGSAVITVGKKPLYLEIQLNEDTFCDVLRDRLTKAMNGMCNETNICLSFSNWPMVVPQSNDKLTTLAHSCVYM